MKILDYEKLLDVKVEKDPFDYIIIDNLFDNNFLTRLLENFPKFEELSWWKYDNYFEKKLSYNSIDNLSSEFKEYFNEVNSRDFSLALERIFNIDNIISDPSLLGGGLHKIQPGGKLHIHADFNYHKITGWKRKLNLITYLNLDWKEEYGGCTEFWDRDMKNCVKKVEPIFNRSVVFCVDSDSYHGHPDPLNFPKGTSRMSLASYYYIHHDKNIDLTKYRSTDYKARPQDDKSEKIESLREKRRKGRLIDLKT